MSVVELRAVLSAAERDDLPDEAFAHIESGGKKDDEGKTTPRKLRHYPVHDSCLAADTRIKLLDGRTVAIADLAGHEAWIYAYDVSRRAVVPALATDVRVTLRGVPVLRITLDSGETVRCTGNHPFLMRDGVYRRADELVEGDSLMPLYTRSHVQRSRKAYEQVFQPFYGFWDWTHRMVARESLGRPLHEKHVVHHDNADPFDNRPGNLIEMGRDAHCALEGQRAGWAHLPALQAGSRKRWERDGERERVAAVMRAENERRRREGLMGDIGEKISNSKLRLLPLEEMHERYMAGASLASLASEYGCCRTTVRNHFCRAGLPLKADAAPHNHSVVEVVEDGVADVYDLSVPGPENFALACGVFVHNSHATAALARANAQIKDGDDDAKSIAKAALPKIKAAVAKFAKEKEEKSAVWAAQHRDDEESYQGRMDLLEQAVNDKFGSEDDDWRPWVQDFTDTWVVYRLKGDSFQCPYTMDDDGAVKLGKATQVHVVTSYEPLESKSAQEPDVSERDEPTAEDYGITNSLKDTKMMLAATKAKQLSDPDYQTDPDDAAVMGHIEEAEAAIDQALIAQSKDCHEDPPKRSKNWATAKRAFTSLVEQPPPHTIDVQIETRSDAEGDEAHLARFVGYPSPTGVSYSVRDWLGEYSEPLALDTPVPTVAGWSTVGDLKVGDEVFGSDGQPCRVEFATPIYRDRDCYEVSFSDGERIVASAEHGWTVERLMAGKRQTPLPRAGLWRESVTISTADMARSVRFGKQHRHRMPVTRMDLPEVEDLPVDPYLLGLWLGDGCTRGDNWIAFDWCRRDDTLRALAPAIEPWEELETVRTGDTGSGLVRIKLRHGVCRRGHIMANSKVRVRTTVGGRVGSDGREHCRKCARERLRGTAGPFKILKARLQGLGVLGNKHIPPVYLRAGTAQREALLQGLMDSDGSINPKGQAQFVNTNSALIDGICELLTSLGHKWSARYSERGNGHTVVHFTPATDTPVFRLPHKYERQRPPSARSQYRHITAVVPVSRVPVRCIGIATADHLFQVGRHAVLTHNCMDPGCYAKTLRERADIPTLFNHDGIPIASTESGTKRLAEDTYGLREESIFDLRDALTNSICVQLQRKVLSKMSISFRAIKEDWNDLYDDRHVGEAALYDTSIVTYPASSTAEGGLVDAMRSALGREGRSLWLADHELSIRSALPAFLERREVEEGDDLLEKAVRALVHADEVMVRAVGPHGRARTFRVVESVLELRAGKALSAKNQGLLKSALDALSVADRQHTKLAAAHDKARDAVSQVVEGSAEAATSGDGKDHGTPPGNENPILPADGAGPRNLPPSVLQARKQVETLRRR